MLTGFSKSLAVLTAFISLAALGAVLVAAAGGPNWRAEADSLKDYEFTRTEGETPTWSSKTRTARPQAGAASAPVTVAQNTAVLPDAIVKTREAWKKEQQDELTKLNLDITALQPKLDEARKLNQQDLEAMKNREIALRAEVAAQDAEIEKLVKESTDKATKVEEIRQELKKRRDDVYRLRNELDAIRTDRFRLNEQQKRLASLLVRMKGTRESLERRESQLVKAGAVDREYEEKPEEKKADDN